MADIAAREDLVARIHELERRLEDLESAARLPVSSIGSGGLTIIDGGSLTIKDPSGNVIAVLGTSGLTISGGAEMEWEDDAGTKRVAVGSTDVGGSQALRSQTFDASGNSRVQIGEILSSVDGSLVGHGILVEHADGADVASIREGRIFLSPSNPSESVLYMEEGEDDYILLYDASGNLIFRAQESAFTVYGMADGGRQKFRVVDANGGNPWIEVKTGDGQTGSNQNGVISCGASNSGGTGYRVLRIPN